MTGPGKYDDLCTMVQKKTQAAAVVLIVAGGNKGNGFSVQARSDLAAKLPAMLRTMAQEIEKNLATTN